MLLGKNIPGLTISVIPPRSGGGATGLSNGVQDLSSKKKVDDSEEKPEEADNLSAPLNLSLKSTSSDEVPSASNLKRTSLHLPTSSSSSPSIGQSLSLFFPDIVIWLACTTFSYLT